MDKLKMQSPNVTQGNIDKIRQLFPACVTETFDKEGNLSLSVDFDILRQELSENLVEGERERFRLDWPGKIEAAAIANMPTSKTLRPDRSESKNFETTGNIFIEGDNLEALKLLQESFLGKVSFIYIDPPYNTGNDFVYDDSFLKGTQEFLQDSGQVAESGERLVANTQSNGRFHSDWLSMMYPRLKLARNLLASDGAIFVNIDDTELANLKKLLDEVFGEENFIANVAWKHTQQSKNDERYFARTYNSLLAYRKSEQLSGFRLPRAEKDNKNYSNPDNDPRGDWRAGDVRSPNPRPTLCFDLETPSGKLIAPPEKGWRWSRETIAAKIETGEIVFNSDETKITRKIYLADQDGRTPETVWAGDSELTTRFANSEIKALFDDVVVFDTPKPTGLIRRLLSMMPPREEFLALDFFAGSSSMADAIFQQNALDGIFRKSISVQLAEPTNEKSIAKKHGYETVADISKERIRRAGKRVGNGECHSDWNKDIGFRVLKIDSSNMADVYYSPDQIKQADLLDAVSNIKPDRTAEDLLFQVLIDWGVDLTLPISLETIQGKQVFFVDENSLLACFDTGLTEELVTELAKREPLRVVFRDNGFVSDSVKINAEQIFKQRSPTTDVKAI